MPTGSVMAAPWEPGSGLFSLISRKESVTMSVERGSIHTQPLYSKMWSIMNRIYSLMLCWRRALCSDWDPIFQSDRENNSHALRSININPWLVYFLSWNIHSCFCHFWKKWNKLPGEAATERRRLPDAGRTSRSLHSSFCLMNICHWAFTFCTALGSSQTGHCLLLNPLSSLSAIKLASRASETMQLLIHCRVFTLHHHSLTRLLTFSDNSFSFISQAPEINVFKQQNP